MDFKMNAVIHRGRDYPKSLASFQHKRMEFIEQELRAFDTETLRTFILSLQRNGRTMEKITGLKV
ncbi:MAG: hypothetical protein Q4D44_08460 [Eubacteriales bacterium]|nr:hypothetical protein [Eubacteriales bacterium]